MKRTKMDDIVENFADYICDHICQKPKEITNQEQLEDYCKRECWMNAHMCRILKLYNEINDFKNSEPYKLMEKYQNIVLCKECKYSGVTKTGKMYCTHKTEVFDYYKNNKDGCSKGERKDE